jgi:hypothetical protein
VAYPAAAGHLIAMPTADHQREIAPVDAAVRQLLDEVRLRFYAGHHPVHFHRDRQMLLYAITWPAHWLERRGLTCSATRYRSLIAERFAVIVAHGDPARYGAYFPSYLLKCLQDWFDRYGEDLYHELKHIRNALDRVLASARFAATVQRDALHVEMIAAAHRIISERRDHRAHRDEGQLPLF